MAPLPILDMTPNLSISRLPPTAGPTHPIPRNLRDFIDSDLLQEMEEENEDVQEALSPPTAPNRSRSSRTRGGDSLQQLPSSM